MKKPHKKAETDEELVYYAIRDMDSSEEIVIDFPDIPDYRFHVVKKKKDETR